MRNLKGILITLALGFAAIGLAVWDPFNLNPNGLNGTSAWALLYAIPSIYIFIYLYKKDNK